LSITSVRDWVPSPKRDANLVEVLGSEAEELRSVDVPIQEGILHSTREGELGREADTEGCP